jgi:hypothetical protein
LTTSSLRVACFPSALLTGSTSAQLIRSARQYAECSLRTIATSRMTIVLGIPETAAMYATRQA